MKQSVLAVTAVAVVTALTMSACSSTKHDTGSGSTNSAGGPKHKVTFVPGAAGDAFYVTMGCGIKAEAAKAGNIEVDIQAPARPDSTVQNPIIASATTAKPDVLLIAPDSPTASDAPIKQAMRAGIKVILVGTTLKDPTGAVSQIASDDFASGAEGVQALEQLLPDGGKVLVVANKSGVTTTDLRVNGFAGAVKGNSKFNYVGVQYDQHDVGLAAQVTTQALQKDPDIVGIFATNSLSAEGVATAVKQAGKQGQVKIVGFDAGPDQIKMLQDGTVGALVAQSPYLIGTQAVEQATAALSGKPTTGQIGTQFTILTKGNLDSAEGKSARYKTSC